MQRGIFGYPRGGNQEVLTLKRGPDIGFTIAARYGDTGLTIPVPTMRPTKDNSSFALDLAPKGPNPVEFAGNGFCWIDVCDGDVQDTNALNGTLIPVGCARVAMASTGAQFGYAPFNGATMKAIEFIQGAATPVARMTQAGFQFGSATRVPVSRIEATDDTIVNFINVFGGEGVVGTSTNHPYSVFVNNIKQATFNLSNNLAGLVSLTRTGGVSIEGTNTNDNAASGRVGEVIFQQVVVGSALALTTATPLNVCFIDLPPGDWEVTAQAYLNVAATTNWTNFQYSISSTSATIDVTPGKWNNFTQPGAVPGASNLSFGALNYRVPNAGAGTLRVYLVAQDAHTVSTSAAWGVIYARRPR